MKLNLRAAVNLRQFFILFFWLASLSGWRSTILKYINSGGWSDTIVRRDGMQPPYGAKVVLLWTIYQHSATVLKGMEIDELVKRWLCAGTVNGAFADGRWKKQPASPSQKENDDKIAPTDNLNRSFLRWMKSLGYTSARFAIPWFNTRARPLPAQPRISNFLISKWKSRNRTLARAEWNECLFLLHL